jgi:hypothetical protein
MRYTGAKGKAWKAVKRWSRRKYKNCYTCPARDLVSFNAQAGHCWPVAIVGSNNTLSWDEKQIRLQCSHCNGPGQGMQEVFIAKLTQELGAEAVRKLRARVYKVDPVKDWNAIKEKFDKL